MKSFLRPIILLTACIWFSVLASNPVWGSTFCVDSATGLQTALTTSGANGASDVIKLVQGTYTGSFYFSSNEAYDLSIEGGYTAGCGSRTVNATNTVLDGAGTDVVLVLSDQRFPVTIA